MSSFKSVPQRRAHTHDADWTRDFLASAKRVPPKKLAANRAKIDEQVRQVRQGKIKPIVLPVR